MLPCVCSVPSCLCHLLLGLSLPLAPPTPTSPLLSFVFCLHFSLDFLPPLSFFSVPPQPPALSHSQTVASRAPPAALWAGPCPPRVSGRGRPASRFGVDTSVGGLSSLTAGS